MLSAFNSGNSFSSLMKSGYSYFISGCKQGTFGPNCPWTCNCEKGIQDCDDLGKCRNGCREGLYGPLCMDGKCSIVSDHGNDNKIH